MCALTACPSSHQPKLKNPAGSERQNDYRTEDHREQQRHRQRQVAMEEQEIHLHALKVLQDEDKNHDQSNDADDKRRPSSTEARLSLARKRSPRLYILIRGTFDGLNLTLIHMIVERMRKLDHFQSVGSRRLVPFR